MGLDGQKNGKIRKMIFAKIKGKNETWKRKEIFAIYEKRKEKRKTDRKKERKKEKKKKFCLSQTSLCLDLGPRSKQIPICKSHNNIYFNFYIKSLNIEFVRSFLYWDI